MTDDELGQERARNQIPGFTDAQKRRIRGALTQLLDPDNLKEFVEMSRDQPGEALRKLGLKEKDLQAYYAYAQSVGPIVLGDPPPPPPGPCWPFPFDHPLVKIAIPSIPDLDPAIIPQGGQRIVPAERPQIDRGLSEPDNLSGSDID